MPNNNLIIDDSIINILKKYFIFDKIFNLLDYDYNMEELHTQLKVLRKDSYEPNYRFVFLHYDTEFYLNNTVGLTTYNLQVILQDLDIPNYFCLLITQQNIQQMLNHTNTQLTADPYSVAVLQNFLHTPLHQDTDKNLELNPDSITSHYISLNGVRRFHRRVLVSLLKEKQLLDKGIVSYGKIVK